MAIGEHVFVKIRRERKQLRLVFDATPDIPIVRQHGARAGNIRQWPVIAEFEPDRTPAHLRTVKEPSDA